MLIKVNKLVNKSTFFAPNKIPTSKPRIFFLDFHFIYSLNEDTICKPIR